MQRQEQTEELQEAEAPVVLVAVIVKMLSNGELLSEVLDVLISLHIDFCDLDEVGLQGQEHIGLASTIVEEATRIRECNSTLNAMDINVLKPP